MTLEPFLVVLVRLLSLQQSHLQPPISDVQSNLQGYHGYLTQIGDQCTYISSEVPCLL